MDLQKEWSDKIVSSHDVEYSPFCYYADFSSKLGSIIKILSGFYFSIAPFLGTVRSPIFLKPKQKFHDMESKRSPIQSFFLLLFWRV